MRPFTNRGLRRKRPPRTRATVTRIVSSPLPSLPTDTGGRYMSLSTGPSPCDPHLVGLGSAVVVPSRIRHAAREHRVLDSERNDGEGPLRGSVDVCGPQ